MPLLTRVSDPRLPPQTPAPGPGGVPRYAPAATAEHRVALRGVGAAVLAAEGQGGKLGASASLAERLDLWMEERLLAGGCGGRGLGGWERKNKPRLTRAAASAGEGALGWAEGLVLVDAGAEAGGSPPFPSRVQPRVDASATQRRCAPRPADPTASPLPT